MIISPPLRPPPPLAKRLNRNALTVAAVVMGMTVLTAVVVVHPSREAREQPPAERAPEDALGPSRPAFLDEPVRVLAARVDTPAAAAGGVPTGGAPVSGGQSSSRASVFPREDAARWSAFAARADTDSLAPTSGPMPSAGASSLRRRAYQAALRSSLLVATSRTPAEASGPTEGPSLASEEQRLLGLGDSVLRAATRSGASDGGAGGGGAGQETGAAAAANVASRQRAFLDAVGDAKGATVIARLDPAGSPYTLRAGTVIPGLLLTGINSELPGDLVAQVSRDVYDSRTQRALLIPKGARLIGTYDNRVAAGEGRLLVAWTRLILPDGRSMRLPGLALKDPQGQTGAKDQVDTHWHRVFGNALLLSAISAGVQLSQPQQTTAFAPPSAGQVAAGALGQELSNVALEVLRRGIDVAPTITIRQGQPFAVFLNGDLVFDGPYADERNGIP